MNEFLDKVINGNCVEILKQLPTDSVDLVLTDPPYGIGELKGTITKDRARNNYDKFDDTPEYYKTVVVEAIKECLRVAKRVVLTPGNRNFTYLPQPDDFGCFYQPATPSISRWGRPDAQPIFYYGKSPHRNITQVNSKQLTEKPSCTDHPCSKPIKAWIWLLEKSSIEGETVLDPFAGSGTTAVAAIRTNRKFILIEQSKEYCTIAERRIKNERNKLAETCYVQDLALFSDNSQK